MGVIGPTVFLVFTTDQTGTGNGFLLEYFAFGYYELSGYHYDHNHFSSASGSLSWPMKPVEHPMNIFSTFTIQPSISKNPLVLSVNKVDLISLVNGCHHNYFSVHQLFQDGFQVRLRYCQADLLTFATISASSPIVITYTATMGPQQTGIAFSWRWRLPAKKKRFHSCSVHLTVINIAELIFWVDPVIRHIFPLSFHILPRRNSIYRGLFSKCKQSCQPSS